MLDGVVLTDRTPEEIQKEIDRLKKESEKLTEWPEVCRIVKSDELFS